MPKRLTTSFCCYCKRGPLLKSNINNNMAFTEDHDQPRSAVGRSRWVPCCRLCNFLKADLHPVEWFWFIDSHPRYWRTFDRPTQVLMEISYERVRRRAAGEEPMPRYPLILPEKKGDTNERL